jgi:membrane-associated phospholipid phosphatase
VSQPRLRACEWVLIANFGLAAVRLAPRPSWGWLAAIAALAAALSLALARAEARTGRRAVAVARDWFPLPFILAGYWTVDLFRNGVQTRGFPESSIALDRFLLHECGLKAAIESLGPVVPFALEFCYLLLYALPPLAVAALYIGGQRKRVPVFLLVLLLAAFTTDTLMLLFPSADPRLVFPGQDLPARLTPFRSANLLVLDNLDVQLSVFPSGHVTVGLATAFGLWLAWPARKRVGAAFFLVACAVALAAVYGRYHYAVDALAGGAVSLAAAALAALLHLHRRQDAG